MQLGTSPILEEKPALDFLRQNVDNKIDNLIQHFNAFASFNNEMLDNPNIALDCYKRNNIEIILRLRMKRWIDALTIHYFTKNDPTLAKKWSQYTDDEMLHDRMFAKDLNEVGVTNDEIYSTEPFFATKLLQGYFYYGLEHEGKPLASLASSYFIEYASIKTQPAWLDHWEKKLGVDKVRGARGHLNHDIEDKHIDFVWNVLKSFMHTKEDEDKLIEHISNVYKLFFMYFHELYTSISKKDVKFSLTIGENNVE